jgi:hypothetical protein
MSILGYIGLVLFLLFCIGMIWQIHSDMTETSRAISRGYGFANITHSAQVFEATGVDLLGNIDYLADDHKPVIHKKNKPRKQKWNRNRHFEFEI